MTFALRSRPADGTYELRNESIIPFAVIGRDSFPAAAYSAAMTSEGFSDIRVATAAPESWRETLALAFGGRGPELAQTQADDALAKLRAGAAGQSVELFEARRDGRLLGAAWVQMQPGCTASLQPPQLVAELAEPFAAGPSFLPLADFVVDQLLGRAADFALAAEARLIQTLLPPDSEALAYRLREAGFQRSAELYFLVSPASAFPAERPESELEFKAVDDEGPGARGEGPGKHTSEVWSRLERMVEQTYVDTLDCPQLNGVRSIEEILAGYQAVGQFDPRRWLLVRHASDDIGCLLLAEHPGRIWELVYMGLAPRARGRRWGVEIARHAQWLAREAGAENLVLAVDAQNEPAIRAYVAAGMIAWERRGAWLKIL